ncbi:hypothetical protein [Halobellus sp. GM3]|uniref:hypothetical protein n=1 Tax=Halobellus sp. GM3 TaxID=3458410 RepID=UPI00403DE5A9
MATVAGCSGSSNDIQDSDGDGVIDSEDYAPHDPEVQEKSDLRDTTTVTPIPEPTSTPVPTTTNKSEDETLRVTDDYWQDISHITEYSADHVSVEVSPEHPSADFDTAKVFIGIADFSRNQVLREILSSEFEYGDQVVSRTVEIDSLAFDPDSKYYYYAGLVSGDVTSTSTVDPEQAVTIMETDAFRWNQDSAEITATSFPNELSDDSGGNYSRNSVEGAYLLELSGRSFGQRWTVDFFARKSAYSRAVQRSRGRSRPEYVQFELTSGTATGLAKLLQEVADDRDYSDTEAAAFVIDFVQALPYVPDDVSKGYDDYTKFIMETVTEMGGDCEDTAVLLASILQAEPFNYDTILIQPPGHMAVGIYQSNPSGYYFEFEGRKYSYVETTGQGWSIGDCPEEYQGVESRLYQV